MLSIDGLVTGIDTSTIIEGLLEVQQRQIDQFDSRRKGVVVEQTAFAGVEARLINFRSSLSSLARSQNNVFRGREATSSNEDFLTVSAGSSAAKGVYSLTINSLARAHQVAAGGLDDPGSQITQGTIDLRVGGGATTTITIDSSNDTLQGLADTINGAGAGVSASIVNDGSGSSAYRLLLTSSKSGASNAISITNNQAPTGGGATQLAFDLNNPVQAAADASVTLGSGAGAITVSNATNKIDSLIPGVSLDLRKADSGTPLTVQVNSNIAGAQDAVRNFVESYNGLMEFIDEQVRFNGETNVASPLLGNRSVIDIQDEIRLAITSVVPNVKTGANRLTAIGISVTSQGRLSLDESKLANILNGGVPGVDGEDVARLFALDGASNSPNLKFIVGSTRTKAGDVQVDITSAAEKAQVTAGSAVGGSVVIDSSNNQLQIKLDGRESSTLTLADGTYTPQELADHIESVANNDDELLGRKLNVSLTGSQELVFGSNSYGKNSEITLLSGSALATLGFSGGETDTGQDVVGKFIVDGKVETAQGRGQILVGDSENEFTADLQVRATFTNSQLQAGAEGQLTVTRGIASKLDLVLDGLLDPVTGRVKTLNDSFDEELKGIQFSIDRLNAQFEASQQSLIEQFVALESAVADLQGQASFISGQLSGFSGLR